MCFNPGQREVEEVVRLNPSLWGGGRVVCLSACLRMEGKVVWLNPD